VNLSLPDRLARDPVASFVAAFVVGCIAEHLLSGFVLRMPMQFIGLWRNDAHPAAAAVIAIMGAGLVWAGSAYAREQVRHRRAMRAVVTATVLLMTGFSLLQTAALSHLIRAMSESGLFHAGVYWGSRLVGWVITIGTGIWLYRQAAASESAAQAAGHPAPAGATPDVLRKFLGNLLVAVGVLIMFVAGACAIVLGIMDRTLIPTALLVSGVTALVGALPIALGRWLRQTRAPEQ
jgi:uncharacterized membrane protein